MTSDNNRPFVQHLVAELSGVDYQVLNSTDIIKGKLYIITDTINAKVLGVLCHKFNIGVSVIFLISASHISVHTWPEKGYMHIDIVTSSEEVKVDLVEGNLKRQFAPSRIKIRVLNY